MDPAWKVLELNPLSVRTGEPEDSGLVKPRLRRAAAADSAGDSIPELKLRAGAVEVMPPIWPVSVVPVRAKAPGPPKLPVDEVPWSAGPTVPMLDLGAPANPAPNEPVPNEPVPNEPVPNACR